MSNDLVMVFAQGFTFVGKQSAIEQGILKDAIEVKTTFVMSQQGLAPVNVNRKIGDLKISFSQVPHCEVNVKSDTYRDYVKLISGIDIPSDGLSH